MKPLPPGILRLRFYVLDGLEPMAADNEAWGAWFQRCEHHIAWDVVDDKVTVSTIFTGIDTHLLDIDHPLLFETMVFGGVHDRQQWRYSTWEEAHAGHLQVLDMVHRALHKRRTEHEQQVH
jgi:hypothetical protein